MCKYIQARDTIHDTSSTPSPIRELRALRPDARDKRSIAILTRTSDVLICQLHEHTKNNRQKRNLKCIRARACGAAHDTSTSRMKYTHKHLTITVQGRQALRPGPHDPRSRTTNSSTGHTLIDAKRNSTIPTRKRGRRNDELKTRRIYRLERDVDATTRYRPGTCTDQGEM